MTFAKVARSFSNHPYLVNAIDQLPDELLTLVKTHPVAKQACEEIFVVPKQVFSRNWGGRIVPQQALIFTQQGILHVEEPLKKGVGEVCWISAEDILMIKLSLILLYGKIEIWGINDGTTSKIEVEYNTVAHPLVQAALHRLIRKTWVKNPAIITNYPQNISFDDFVKTSFSFYNGIRNQGLQPEEKLLNYVYQPEIIEPWLRFFHKKIAPQIVLALTDQQLLILQEDLELRTHHEWIFSFIPLYRIFRVDQATFEKWQKILIHLLPDKAKQRIEVIFESDIARKFYSNWIKVAEYLSLPRT